MHAIEADVTATHDKALARAQDLLTRAQAEWRQYRANGAIGGTQRLESGISGGFRSQAHLLSEAQSLAQQGMRIYTQLKADHPSDWDTLLASVRLLTERFPPETVVYPGHGPATTLGVELARNPYLAELRA